MSNDPFADVKALEICAQVFDNAHRHGAAADLRLIIQKLHGATSVPTEPVFVREWHST